MSWMRGLTCGLSVLFVFAGVSSARAGEILFSIRDGRVTLVARDAQLSDILAVWEREGRTTIVARERVRGMVASLELTNEPESTALATILRSVTGFIAAKHAVAPRDGSIYRCIIINPVPAPPMVAQTGSAGRTAPAPSPQIGMPPQMGMPPSMLGNPGMFPPAFVPSQPDESDESGLNRGMTPAGMRQPGMTPPTGMPRPPFDTSGVDPASNYPQPTQTPGFPGSASGVPGVVVPTPRPPGTPAQPAQKPPGRPPGVA